MKLDLHFGSNLIYPSNLALRGHFFELASKLDLRNRNHFAKRRPTFGTDPNPKCLWGGAKEPTGLANLLERRERYELRQPLPTGDQSGDRRP